MSVKALAGTRSKTPSRLHVFAEGLKEPSPHQNVSCDPQHQWHILHLKMNTRVNAEGSARKKKHFFPAFQVNLNVRSGF